MKLSIRSWITIAVTSLVGVFAFALPFIAPEASSGWIFLVLVPMLLVLVFVQLADGDLDAKRIAVLGVLAAVVCALRPLGGGAAGIEPIWFVIVIAGRALGPGFGFTLGSTSMLASALLTGGVGPWLPFQMLAAGWVGLGAGCLPRATGKHELALTAAYGGLAAFGYGFIMNLWFAPYLVGTFASPTQLLAFAATTSLGFDLPRALLTVALIALAGRPMLFALRRVTQRAAFTAPVVFTTSL